MLFLVVVVAIFNLVNGKEVTCEKPVSPEHGSLRLLGDRKVNSFALYLCDNGWKLIGVSAAKCLDTGQWTSSPPRCIEEDSLNPDTPTALVVTPAPVPSPPPERKATPGVIEKQDTHNITLTPEHAKEDECFCTYNGQGKTLSAKVNGLPVRYEGKVKKGDKMTISCYDEAKHLVLPNDTRISGTLNFSCDACQTWTDAILPSCGDDRSEITCRELIETDLMKISYTDNLSVGSIANFHCFAPGIRSGVARTQCLQTGEWSHSPPTCQNICLLPMVIGTCDDKVPSWYFDSDSKTCEIFTYSGCFGNSNRFATKVNCEAKCINQQTSNCKDSKHGCCPDGMTSAGLNYEGCNKVNISSTNVSCEEAEFGCCSDGFTLALGPFKKGCPSILNCNKTKFYCCPDAETIAKRLNMEGCPEENNCTNSTHGCCSDGRTETTGLEIEGCLGEDCRNATFNCCSDGMRVVTCPNLERCETSLDNKGCKNVTDCISSKFGCCLDNMAAALGSDLEGCNGTVTDKPPELTTELIATCTNTLFGCCPDEITIALGPNLEGCCFGFRFGCCPDNKTVALGPSYRGCGCLTYPYGCCPDGINAAQGKNYQGCQCEHFRYGCCQDNATPAKGPNFEGCTCQFTQYGCCPDGRTPILNERGEGCGCGSTRYGCCPDGKTAATTADLPGCPCDTLPYGCCPDGHTPARTSDFRDCPCEAHRYGCCLDGRTIARGPAYEGCPCVSTRFGCCMDGKTTAQGPDFEGCPCHITRYGCCDDGYTPASGFHYEGCPDVQPPKPPVSTEVCSLPKEAGPCRDFNLKWFYDVDYGGCSRFWYGGCDANGNVFANKEDCEKVCVNPEGPEICLLPKASGPCYDRVPSWYFDTGSKKCEAFTYGGCLGNSNRFVSKMDCEAKCISKQSTNICSQSQDPGPCLGYYRYWYYDGSDNACKSFVYGGCKGNDNRFEDRRDCEQRCVRKTPKVPVTTAPETSKSANEDVCRLPVAPGPCDDEYTRWFYDAQTQSCLPFVYGGCEGNKNRFRTAEICLRFCTGIKVPVTTAPETSKSANEGKSGREDVTYVSPSTSTTTALTTSQPQCPPSNCGEIQCPYGIEESFDNHGCSSCRCSNPCEVQICPEGSRCAIDVTRTALGGVRTVPVCRRVHKPGVCSSSAYSAGPRDCETRCRDDADCRGEYKCCNNGCAFTCLPPSDEPFVPATQPEPATILPGANVTQGHIGQPAELPCNAMGWPKPIVTWWRDTTMLPLMSQRYEQLPNYALLIRSVVYEDGGDYSCHALNGIGSGAVYRVTLIIDFQPELPSAPRGEENDFNSRDSEPDVEPLPPPWDSAKPSDSDCVDDPWFSNCNVVVNANYCNNKYYGKFCCASCMKAGQL